MAGPGPGPIRVMIIDDSVVVRRLVSSMLAADPEIEVVATASNGRQGLTRLPQAEPDLVILDVEMPELGGLDTLVEIRRERPKLPVIMFSSLTRRGAAATLDALSLGASDYVTKPSANPVPGELSPAVWESLVTKIKFFCRRPEPAGPTPSAALADHPPLSPDGSPWPFPRMFGPKGADLIVIAASTGGPNALTQVISALPADLGAPVLIVQHMPPVFTGLLAERLDSRSPLEVREAIHGETIRPGQARIAPGDYHMNVGRRQGSPLVELHQGPQENSCRPAADVLFRSAADAFGSSVLGIVMTGMGQDGLKGSIAIRERGGLILAQDEATSVVWGMPGYVANAGLAERVLPLGAIASAIVGRTRSVNRGRSPVGRAQA